MTQSRVLDEIGFAARLEQQSDIAFHRRLVALDAEIIVRLPLLDQIGGDFALGQHGVGGEVLACDVATFKHRNRHADLECAFNSCAIGALLFLAARYRQCTHFFWV